MDALPLREPPSHEAVRVPPETLARIEVAYEHGRYLDAWALARPVGPLGAWRGADALVLAGRLAQQLGDPRLCARLQLRAFREHPGSPAAWAWGMRTVSWRLGPLAALETARRRPPPRETAEVLAFRAEVAVELRDFDEAERLLARARAVAPADPWIPVLGALALQEADAYEEALAHLDRAFDARPWYRPALDARADLLILLGRDDEALALLEEGMRRLQAPSVATELVGLQIEHGRYEAAEATLDRLEELTPLRDRHRSAWLDARRSDTAYHRGDLARAASLARRAGASGIAFYERLAERLDARVPPGRVLLPVPWIRQHRLTCAPATMTALVRHFGGDARHLEVAEAICYDGTPDHAQRRWADRQGLVARELTVTWESATALLDRGVPFALTTVDPGSAHMQAVIGYDRARRTLLLRDPYFRYLGELVGDTGLADYAACGPKGLVLLPAAEAGRLDGLDLPETGLHDAYHRVQAALVAHDRAGAASAAAELRAAAPGHRLALQADRSIASYDADEPARLRATEALLALFPDDVNLRLSKQASLADLGRRDERIAWLRAECARAGHPLLRLALAEVLRADARAQPEALRIARAAARGRNAGAYHTLGHVLWDRGERDSALLAYRAAACLERTDERFAESYFLAARLAGRAEEAIAFLRDRFERQGRKAAWPAFTLYDALDLLDRRREAHEVLERAIAWRPADGPLLLFAARARAAASDTAAAEALLARAGAAARPDDVKRSVAQIAETRGDLVAAAAAWRELAELEPFNLDAVRATARLLEATRGAAEAVAFLRARVDRHPHHHGLCRLLAEWLATGEPDAREAAIRRILEANPSDAWAWRELALALSAARRTDEALAAVARAGEIDPFSATFHSVRGFVLEDAGRIDEAKAALAEALRTSVDEEWALRELLRISTDAEERERHLAFVHAEIVRQVLSGDALLGYQRAAAGVLDPERLAAELRAAWEARPDLWHAWVALARQLGVAGRPAEAVALLARGAERFELLPRIWLELADAHRAAGDRGAQRKALERAVTLAPGWPDAVVRLAELLHVDREFERERAMLAHAVRRAPTHAVLRGWLADASWEAGEREAAVAELERALALDPTYGWAWERLSTFSRELGRPDAALAAAERIAAERAHDAHAWVLAARARPGIAGRLEAVDRALALSPLLAAAHELRVDVLADAGRTDEALAAARAPILAGHVPRALRLKAARVQAERGDRAGARVAVEELLGAEPDYADAWAQLAQWHEDAGRHEDAVAAARRLVRLAPSEAVPHAYLARALLGAGDRDGGKAELRRAMALDPGYGWAASRLVDAELEDRDPDAAAAVLPVIERHAPDDAPLVRLRIAAARNDRAATLAGLDALARAGEGEGERLDAAARALSDAGWAEALDARLDALLVDASASRAAGALFASRAQAARWPRSRRRRLREALQAAPPAPAALGAAEARLDQLAAPARRIALRLFVRRHRAALAADADTWGSVGYALSTAREHRRAVAWLAGWRARAGLRPWMLLNLANSLRDLGRAAEAAEVGRAALALPPDHTTPMHEVMLAMDAALAGDALAAGRLGREHRALGPHYRFLVELVEALASSEAGGDRRAAFRSALRHVRAADAAMPDRSGAPWLGRARRGALRRIARRRAGSAALAPVFAIVARAAVWLLPGRTPAASS
jgi:predicted Zn-dependent protease